MKKTFHILLLLLIVIYSSRLYASETCDERYYTTHFRKFNTVFYDSTNNTFSKSEAENIRKLLLENIDEIPNNVLFTEQKKDTKPDRIIECRIIKTVKKRENYAGDTGKDQYLIKVYTTVYYDIDISLKEKPGNKEIFKYKKKFRDSDLKEVLEEIHSELKVFYSEPVRYCVKKEIKKPELNKEYFLNAYLTNGFPVQDYREFVKYSCGAGVMPGVKNIIAENFILAAYIESSYHKTNNSDINYAVTLHFGTSAGYNINAGRINIIPEISPGYIFSYYSVKYPDMESSYRNLSLRFSTELNAELLQYRFFIKPAVTSIFEKGNVLYSIDLLTGIKIMF